MKDGEGYADGHTFVLNLKLKTDCRKRADATNYDWDFITEEVSRCFDDKRSWLLSEKEGLKQIKCDEFDIEITLD